NEPLDLVSAPTLASFVGLAWRASQRGVRQHAVFAGHPALAAIAQKLRHRVFNGGRADDASVAEFDQARTFGSGDEVGDDVDRPHLLRRTIIGAIDHKRRLYVNQMSAISRQPSAGVPSFRPLLAKGWEKVRLQRNAIRPDPRARHCPPGGRGSALPGV